MTTPHSDLHTVPLPRRRAHPTTGPYRSVLDTIADVATERFGAVPPAPAEPATTPTPAPTPTPTPAPTPTSATPPRPSGAGMPLAAALVVVAIAGVWVAGWGDPGTLGALALVSTATLLGAWVATRYVGRLGLWLSLASAMMMVSALTDILPHVWHEAEEVGVGLLAPGAALVVGFVVLTLVSRDGHGHGHGPSFGVVGAATALTMHRVIEGATLALTGSVPVVAALLVHSASEGLALAALFAQARRSVIPWLTIAVAGPAVGVVVASVSPLPEAIVPVLLALVAGVLLRTAVVGLGMAAAKRRSGELANRHIALAVAAAAALGMLSFGGH